MEIIKCNFEEISKYRYHHIVVDSEDFYKLMKLNNSYLFFVSVVDDKIWDSDFDNADMVFKIFNDCYDYLKNITNKIVLVGDKFDNALC